MADFHFFTEPSKLNTQLSNAFGPVSGSLTHDEYRCTSLHTAASDPLAIAVCNGTVLVQQSTDTDLVNVILRPLNQPGNGLPYIKFFIYKGIKKTSLVNVDDVASKPSPESNNELVTSIWNAQEKINNNLAPTNGGTPTTHTPSKDILGIQYSASGAGSNLYTDAAPVEEVFRLAETANPLPYCKAGWSIGTFDKDSIGFEIHFDRMGYPTTFGDARSLETKISVLKFTSGTQAQKFNHWNSKEVILTYLDPCAFYGSMYNQKVSVRDEEDPLTGHDLYTEVLSKFLNKNAVYLDIRNELNYSFNYFGNYTNSSEGRIRLALNSSAALDSGDETNYYSSGWPIMKLTFPGSSSNSNSVKIAFPINDSALPFVFLYRAATPASFPKNVSGYKRFLNIADPPSTGEEFSPTEIELSVMNTNNANPVSDYLHVKYVKRLGTENPAPGGTVMNKLSHFDHLFYPAEMLFQDVDNTGSGYTLFNQVYHDDCFVSMFNYFYSDFIVTRGIVRDNENNVVFYASAKDKFYYFEDSKQNKTPSIVGRKTKNTPDFYSETALNYGFLKRNREIELTDTGEFANVNYFEDLSDTSEDSKAMYYYRPIDFLVFRITEEEYADLISLINGAGFAPGFMVSLGFEQDEFIPDTRINLNYQRFKLKLYGYKEVSGTISIDDVDTGIFTDYVFEINRNTPISEEEDILFF